MISKVQTLTLELPVLVATKKFLSYKVLWEMTVPVTSQPPLNPQRCYTSTSLHIAAKYILVSEIHREIWGCDLMISQHIYLFRARALQRVAVAAEHFVVTRYHRDF